MEKWKSKLAVVLALVFLSMPVMAEARGGVLALFYIIWDTIEGHLPGSSSKEARKNFERKLNTLCKGNLSPEDIEKSLGKPIPVEDVRTFCEVFVKDLKPSFKMLQCGSGYDRYILEKFRTHVADLQDLGALREKIGRSLAEADLQDPAVLRETWHPLAERGHAGAQFNLGVIYECGKGVPQDFAEAAQWYRKAAEQGHAGAQFNLGVMYANGKGVPQDDVQAWAWASIVVPQEDFELARWFQGDKDFQVAWWFRKLDVLQAVQTYVRFFSIVVPQDVFEGAEEAGKHIAASMFCHELESLPDLQGLAKSPSRFSDLGSRLQTHHTASEEISRAWELAHEYWEAYVAPFRNCRARMSRRGG